MGHEGQSRHDALSSCDKKVILCTMRVQTRQFIQSSLTQIEKGVAGSLYIEAILRGSEKSLDRKIETHVALSKKVESLEELKTHVTMRIMIETPELKKPFVVDVETNTITNGPIYLWNI